VCDYFVSHVWLNQASLDVDGVFQLFKLILA